MAGGGGGRWRPGGHPGPCRSRPGGPALERRPTPGAGWRRTRCGRRCMASYLPPPENCGGGAVATASSTAVNCASMVPGQSSDQLPASLAKLVHRQALELSPGRFNADTGPLLRMLERILTELQAPPAVTDPEVTAVASATDAADEQLGGGTWPELEPLPISAEPALRSHVSDQDTEVEFVNGRSEAVVIYWLDFGGRRVRYHRLPPGASYVQPTFVTHPWVITTTDNRPLVIIQPTSEPHRITIR